MTHRSARTALLPAALLACLLAPATPAAAAPPAVNAAPKCTGEMLFNEVLVPAGIDPGTRKLTAKCLLREGDVGNGVKRLQRNIDRCHQIPLAVDGHFGPKTRKAVTAVQSAGGVNPDGIYGPQTLGVMRHESPAGKCLPV